MIIKQLSIFLENKSGRLQKVTEILEKNDVNMSAFSVADTSEFGILRLVVSDHVRASTVLREENFVVNITDVVCLSCPNKPGGLAKALQILDENQISIEYLYAFSVYEKANVVLKPNDVQRCIDILAEHKLDLVRSSELYEL